jgi:tripeptidyl-peptidase I
VFAKKMRLAQEDWRDISTGISLNFISTSYVYRRSPAFCVDLEMENNLTTMLFSLTTVVTVFSLTHAAPSASIWAIHERRQHGNSAWVARSSEVDGRTIIPLSIGLTQRNLEKGHDFLMDVSDPASPNYGKHWTQQQIAETFAPSTETVDEVTAWLLGSGIEKEQISTSEGSAWIRMNATIEQAESLLNTKYKVRDSTSINHQT